MNIRIRAARAGEIHLTPVLPPTLEFLQIPESVCYGASGSFGHVLLQRLDGEGVSMLYHTLYFTSDEQVTLSSVEPAIRLQIVLRNSYYFDSKYLGTGVVHERGLHLHYAPAIDTVLKLQAEETYSHLSIHYAAEHLLPLQSSFPRLRDFLARIGQGQPVIYNPSYCVADSKILSLVDFILNSHYTGHLQTTYFSMLAKDILLEALLRIEEMSAVKHIAIGEEEVRRIYQAKEILLRDIQLPFSLSRLVTETGLNSFRLTREFKAIYGMGMKEFLLETRMKRAMRILSETDTPVVTVSKNSGYATPQSFSLAFKNYFGCTPGSVHRRGRATGGGPSHNGGE